MRSSLAINPPPAAAGPRGPGTVALLMLIAAVVAIAGALLTGCGTICTQDVMPPLERALRELIGHGWLTETQLELILGALRKVLPDLLGC